MASPTEMQSLMGVTWDSKSSNSGFLDQTCLRGAPQAGPWLGAYDIVTGDIERLGDTKPIDLGEALQFAFSSDTGGAQAT